ncbi:MAG: ATP-dependent Clp protease ATP-binding subunit [Verrucomicrobiae bacterium]|nr:ATP-dependent Clp protease ATP-binding subunit [Verrucomicrobiae bacterium]
MPQIPFELTTVGARLAAGWWWLTAPGFPEVGVLGESAAAAERVLVARVRQVLGKTPLMEIHRRRGRVEAEVRQRTLRLTPMVRHPWWGEPVDLTVDYVLWHEGGETDTVLAWVPVLALTVVVQGRQDLEKRLESEVRGALARRRLMGTLGGLARLWQPEGLETGRIEIVVEVPTTKQEALAREEDRESDRRVLEEVGLDVGKERIEATWENEGVVGRLATVLGGNPPRSVLLVGPSGVGKTAAFRELVRRRQELGFPDTPFFATSGARLVAGMSGYGMWQERCLKMVREASHRRAVVHLGGIFELIQVGASVANAQGIGSFLRPHLMRGELLAVTEATVEELALVERMEPQLLRAFEEVRCEEPGMDAFRRILRETGRASRSGGGRGLSEEGLDAVVRLHARYGGYSARPGRALRFVRPLLQEGVSGDGMAGGGKVEVEATLEVDGARVREAFRRETGLPRWLLDETVAFDPDAARRWFEERVIGQEEAVEAVVSTLALVKTRLARPRRPLASFLFVGPTGVGKTEMVKAQAEYLFGDRTRMVRFDMSEYAHGDAVERLAGGAWDREGLLTARLREQPFCVVLLDEFEKAHPAVHDLLLQVLGEARLTDAAGRLAWFGNAVVVLTSNLGAQEFQRAPAGFRADAGARRDAREHFTGVVERFLRPEMVNRLDGIIPFLPLDEGAALAVTRRELGRALERDGIRRRMVEVDCDPALAEHLMRLGFDPAYGARPLQRVIERELLVPLAHALNGFAEDQPVQAWATVSAGALRVRCTGVRPAGPEDPRRDLAGVATGLSELRRRAQRLRRSAAVRELENAVHRAEELRARMGRGQWVDASSAEAVARLPRRQALLRALEGLELRSAEAEAGALVGFHTSREEACLPEAQGAAEGLTKEMQGALEELLWDRTRRPDRILLGLYHRGDPAVFAGWVRAMVKLARERELAVRGHFLVEGGSLTIGRQAVRLRVVPDVMRHLDAGGDGLRYGLVLEIEGRLALPKLEVVAGWHAVRRNRETQPLLARIEAADLLKYRPPPELGARSWGGDSPRYLWDQDEGMLSDRTGTRRAWNGDIRAGLEPFLTAAFEARLNEPLTP